MVDSVLQLLSMKSPFWFDIAATCSWLSVEIRKLKGLVPLYVALIS